MDANLVEKTILVVDDEDDVRESVREVLSDEGYRVVIATNPLFPATAIEQRLDWAGVRDFPYALVTTMENSHFSKPNPRYYEEILAKIQSAPETTWMIGDNPTNDIIPARTLGLKTWWITDAIPLFATALLPLILYPLLGIESGAATAPSSAPPGCAQRRRENLRRNLAGRRPVQEPSRNPAPPCASICFRSWSSRSPVVGAPPSPRHHLPIR